MAAIAGCLSDIEFSRYQTVVAAVSGGSDSTALLVLADEFLKENLPSTRLVAITVDHGLRPEAAAEARQVAALCNRLGVQHFVKQWQGSKPATGIQAAAREARYDLLSEAAAEFGAGLILTGHTRDDLIETVLMRQERGEGPGLAAIAPATLAFRDDGSEPVWFARPFLGTSRLQLRDELLRRDIGWVDDPTNANTDFERVRAREKLAALAPGLIEALIEKQAAAAIARMSLSRRLSIFMTKHVSGVAAGLFRISPELAGEEDVEAAGGVLRVVMALAGGSERMIDEGRATGLLEKIRHNAAFRATGSRALIDRRRQGAFVMRENRNVSLSGDIYDGRYAVRSNLLRQDQLFEASEAPRSLVWQARKLEPPQNFQLIRRILNPWPRRVPVFDFAAASALACLAGEAEFPPPPCSL